MLDVANKLRRRKSKQEAGLWQISNEQCPHKGVLFDEIDTNCSIVNSVSIYLTWIFVCLMTYLLTSVFWRGGAFTRPIYLPPRLFKPCYGPAYNKQCNSPLSEYKVKNWSVLLLISSIWWQELFLGRSFNYSYKNAWKTECPFKLPWIWVPLPCQSVEGGRCTSLQYIVANLEFQASQIWAKIQINRK